MRGEKHVLVDIDDSWVDSMSKKLATSMIKPSFNDPSTIFLVPRTIRRGDEDAYEPKIISIGPYHRGKAHLQAMEEHKWHYLHDLLSRNEDIRLENCVEEIKAMEPKARLSYSEIINIKSKDFVEMMVLDGCFIVELFLKQKEGLGEDPIHSNLWMLPLICQDMLLLENQLPFFVMQRLFELATKSSPSLLVDLAFDFYMHLLSKNKDVDVVLSTKSIHHLLHLFHSHLLPTPPSKITRSIAKPFLLFHRSYSMSSAPLPKSIPSATELQRAGVKFKNKEDAHSFLDVKFNKGVMEIPPLSINDSTNSLLRNFIAFEQCYPIAGCHFTTYAMLMNFLINTPNDVDLLNQNKIMEHGLGSDNEVAFLFNRLCKGATVDAENCYLQGLFKEVTEYSEDVWHSWRASLKRSYFSSPWAFISLIAATIAFFLTLIMTFFTVYAYFLPRSAGLRSFLIDGVFSQ